jgi:hypothetical protein
MTQPPPSPVAEFAPELDSPMGRVEAKQLLTLREIVSSAAEAELGALVPWSPQWPAMDEHKQ